MSPVVERMIRCVRGPPMSVAQIPASIGTGIAGSRQTRRCRSAPCRSADPGEGGRRVEIPDGAGGAGGTGRAGGAQIVERQAVRTAAIHRGQGRVEGEAVDAAGQREIVVLADVAEDRV